MLYLPTVILVLIQLFFIGMFVRAYRTSGRKDLILWVTVITITLTVWTVINTLLLTDVTDSNKLSTFEFLNKLGFFLGSLSVIEIYYFSFNFPEKKYVSTRKKSLLFLLLALPLFSMLEIFSGRYIYSNDSKLFEYVNGELYLLYSLFVLFFMGAFLLRVRRSRLVDKRTRNQARLVGYGLAGTALYGSIFILILPAIYGDEAILYSLGYMAPIFFIASLSMAIIKHGLFDIRFYIVKAITYIGLTASLIGIYFLFGFRLSQYLQSLTESKLISDIALFLSAIIMAILYRPLRQAIDKITNKVFFQDTYDSENFLETLNKSLVGNVEIDSLLKSTAKIIEAHLNLDFCSFFIRDTSYYKSRLVGDYMGKLTDEEVLELEKLLPKTHAKVIAIQKEPLNINEENAQNILRKNDIEVLVRLVSTLNYEVHGVGYLLLGAKKSGNLFNKQDLKVLEIISDELVIAVQNALRFEEIEQFNVTLQKKIDDATKELKTTNEKLRALDEAKDEFVSMASHQLRTPLTSIKGYLSMVMEGDAGKITPTQKDMLGQAFFSSQRMVYLISDLLNVSRLKTGKFLIESKAVYLPNLVEEEIAQLQDGAKAKNLTLSYTKPKSFPTLNLDDMKIRQVVMNFTDNAIYYTPTGGKITIQLKETPKTVEFTVSDTGIGVPKDQQPKMFTKFFRADNARKARPDGTGLGLFMAKKVVIAQGGSIIFTSKEGKGSTFGFSFPKDKLEVEQG